MTKTITFNGVDSKPYFLINKIKRNILPPLEVPGIKIPRKAGNLSFRTEIGARKIEIDITIMGTSELNIRNTVRTIASYLFTETDRQLIFSEDPNFYYNARLSEETDLNQIAALGEGTLIFICSDPFLYFHTENTVSLTTEFTTITNNGTATAFPVFNVTPKTQDVTTYINIKNETTGRVMQLNGTFLMDVTYKIDMSTNDVIRVSTGERLLDRVDVQSDFWPLARGENVVRVVPIPPTYMSATITFRERYL